MRYLLANLGDLAPRASLLEFEIANRPTDVVERVLREQPRIVGFGVYIWNVRQTTEVVGELRRVAPDVKLVLGGPEVSYDADDLEIVALVDCIVSGEGDLVFADVCRRFLAGEPVERRIAAPFPSSPISGSLTNSMPIATCASGGVCGGLARVSVRM